MLQEKFGFSKKGEKKPVLALKSDGFSVGFGKRLRKTYLIIRHSPGHMKIILAGF